MAGNVSGNAYALTILSPIKDAYTQDEMAYADIIRDRLQEWNFEYNSPMAKVPQTYLCRFFVLDDVYVQSLPGAGALDTKTDFWPIVFDKTRRDVLPKEDHLQSRYLVFSSNFHAASGTDVDAYLHGMWNSISDRIREIWSYCYGFEQVHDAPTFVTYMKKCQLPAALYFNGSNDLPLQEQLKALYLKQEFSQFAVNNQGVDTATLRINFQAFMERVAPNNIAAPTWEPGKYRL